MRPAAIAKNISLTLEDLSNCLVHGDPERLQQVFWNLLSNAVKFTPSGGFVRVDVARNDHTLAVTVADSGVGILRGVHPGRVRPVSSGRSNDHPVGTEALDLACRL